MVSLGTEYSEFIQSQIEAGSMQWEDFTVVNGMLEISRIKPGQSFSYDTTYDSMNCRWYPIGKFNTYTLPNDVPLANKYRIYECPMDVGFIQANYATLVNHNFLDESKPLMTSRIFNKKLGLRFAYIN